jgi:nicotinate-nucleotide adenylyltransferase
MRIALLGGTFNPVHYGHLVIAETARDSLRLDRVVFVPAGLPPHKKAPKTSARRRLAMLRLAVRGNRAFTVSDWEIRQKRVVYAYETLEHFRKVWPRAALYFILGSDSLKNLPRWRESRRLGRMCRFVALPRIDAFASSDVRRRVSLRQSIRYRVPAQVERYILARRLYRRPE